MLRIGLPRPHFGHLSATDYRSESNKSAYTSCVIAALAWPSIRCTTRRSPAGSSGTGEPEQVRTESSRRTRYYKWRRLRLRVLDRDGERCQIRGRRLADHVDHDVPVFLGGADSEENVQSVCQPCHLSKAATEAAAARPRRSRKRGAPMHPADAPEAWGGDPGGPAESRIPQRGWPCITSSVPAAPPVRQSPGTPAPTAGSMSSRCRSTGEAPSAPPRRQPVAERDRREVARPGIDATLPTVAGSRLGIRAGRIEVAAAAYANDAKVGLWTELRYREKTLGTTWSARQDMRIATPSRVVRRPRRCRSWAITATCDQTGETTIFRR